MLFQRSKCREKSGSKKRSRNIGIFQNIPPISAWLKDSIMRKFIKKMSKISNANKMFCHRLLKSDKLIIPWILKHNLFCLDECLDTYRYRKNHLSKMFFFLLSSSLIVRRYILQMISAVQKCLYSNEVNTRVGLDLVRRIYVRSRESHGM